MRVRVARIPLFIVERRKIRRLPFGHLLGEGFHKINALLRCHLDRQSYDQALGDPPVLTGQLFPLLAKTP